MVDEPFTQWRLTKLSAQKYIQQVFLHFLAAKMGGGLCKSDMERLVLAQPSFLSPNSESFSDAVDGRAAHQATQRCGYRATLAFVVAAVELERWQIFFLVDDNKNGVLEPGVSHRCLSASNVSSPQCSVLHGCLSCGRCCGCRDDVLLLFPPLSRLCHFGRTLRMVVKSK